MIDEDRLNRRVTIRLTPYQARQLWKLRTAKVPEGARPRTVTEVLVRALLEASRSIDGLSPPAAVEPPAVAPAAETTLVHVDLAPEDAHH